MKNKDKSHRVTTQNRIRLLRCLLGAFIALPVGLQAQTPGTNAYFAEMGLVRERLLTVAQYELARTMLPTEEHSRVNFYTNLVRTGHQYEYRVNVLADYMAADFEWHRASTVYLTFPDGQTRIWSGRMRFYSLDDVKAAFPPGAYTVVAYFGDIAGTNYTAELPEYTESAFPPHVPGVLTWAGGANAPLVLQWETVPQVDEYEISAQVFPTGPELYYDQNLYDLPYPGAISTTFPGTEVRTNFYSVYIEAERDVNSGEFNHEFATYTAYHFLPATLVKIARVWSDQFPGKDFNSLPASAPNNHGAGSLGNQMGLILMATRADDIARVKAEVTLDPPNTFLRDGIRLQLIRSSDKTVLAASGLTGNIAEFDLPFSGIELECEVVAWLDFDGNGVLSAAAGESLVSAPIQVAIIGKEGYRGAISELREKSLLGLAGLPLPIAWRFLDAFLSHTKPDKASELDPKSIHPDRELSHNVGVVLRDDGTALLRQFEFAGDSDVSERIRQSFNIKSQVMMALSRERVAIQQAFAGGATTYECALFPGPDPNVIEFPPGEQTSWSLDRDLYLAFHAAAVEGAKCIVDRDMPDRVRIEGLLTDTYDFKGRPPGGANSILAARVQAGFGTLGQGGEVFGLRVRLDGYVRNVRWDGIPSLEVGLVGVLRDLKPDGLRIRVECLHAPDRGVVIEGTTDFRNWGEIARDPPGTTGTVLLIDPLANGNDRAFFYRVRLL